jgi:hypothetical protein
MTGGRLGNEMFIYASIVGIAYTNNMAPVYNSSLLAEVFEASAARFPPESLLQGSVTVMEKSGFRRDPRFDKLSSSYSGDVIVSGWLQSFEYFAQCKDSIRQEFTFRSPYRRVAETVLRSIANKHRYDVESRVTCFDLWMPARERERDVCYCCRHSLTAMLLTC